VVADPARPPVAEVTVHAPGGAAPRVRLTGPAAADVPLAERGGEWSGRVTLREPGEYTLEAEAGTGAAAVRASTTFVVEEQDFEMAEVLADEASLRAIAEAGGGTFHPLADLPRLLADVAAGLRPQTEPVERRLPLAGRRVFLACVLAVLAAEWVLRRRWGMV
ncbi:MAG: hypothetical protein IMZ66_05850, partial [Planctomycetes bacterium]|nr:hypothetical protein [Planctomycetota bacterium]